MTAIAEPATAGPVAPETRPGVARQRPRRLTTVTQRYRPRPLSLRTRITLAFALGGMVLSILLALIVWGVVRQTLLNQRERLLTRQAAANASVVQRSDAEVSLETLLQSLVSDIGAQNLLRSKDGTWTQVNSDLSEDVLPRKLREQVDAGSPSRMYFRLDDEPALAVGFPLGNGSQYYEVVSVAELSDTLGVLRITLLAAAGLTTVAGGLLGWWLSRRALLPLRDVSQAAEALAGGDLDTRLVPADDRDLNVLVDSFNHMAEALADRIEREARFTSEVSHELRSPLMTLAASVEVLKRRRDDLPDRAQAALDLLSADVDRFQQLVEDLLEISRHDLGVIRLHLDVVNLPEFLCQAVEISADPLVPVVWAPELVDFEYPVDKRRLVRVLHNLIDNANAHAGGATKVGLEADDEFVRIIVEDAGPGVPEEERKLIFDRFSRGSSAGRRGVDTGVGLGLSLVVEHARLNDGSVWVEDRPDGEPGARFVVQLPRRDTAPHEENA